MTGDGADVEWSNRVLPAGRCAPRGNPIVQAIKPQRPTQELMGRRCRLKRKHVAALTDTPCRRDGMETEMGADIKKDHAWFEHALEQPTQTGLEFPTFDETSKYRVVVARAIEIADEGSDQHRVIVNRKEKAVGNNIDFLVEFRGQLLEPDQGLFKRP